MTASNSTSLPLLGVTNINMFLTPSMKSNLAYMHKRDPHSSLTIHEHIYRRPLIIDSIPSSPDMKATFHSAGAGLFA
jgi:hypothetical protein